MTAAIEAVQLSQRPEAATHSGVICIFCGRPTPAPASCEGTLAAHVGRPNRRVSIVRCEVCGKEAPYLVHEITEFGEMLPQPSASLWFARDLI